MNAILGFSQLGLRDATLTPTQRQYLEIIMRDGKRRITQMTEITGMEGEIIAGSLVCINGEVVKKG